MIDRELQVASIELEELHDVAGIPDGSAIMDYNWTGNHLNIEYFPPDG